MWLRVDIVLTDVSKERIASIFRVEDKKESASETAEQVQPRGCRAGDSGGRSNGYRSDRIGMGQNWAQYL
jgi:hypothetical protein